MPTLRLTLYLLVLLPLQLFSGSTNQTNTTSVSIAPIISYLLSNSEDKNLGRIMPLGDSITWDWHYSDSRPNSQLHAYRSHLWWKLKDKKYKMDFVGSRSNGSAIRPSFDGNNEGYTGQSCTYIESNIYKWLSNNPADTILLHIGTNDSGIHSPARAVYHTEQILNQIDRFERNKKVKVKVILAKIIKLYRNGNGSYDWVIDYNRKLGIMAKKRIDKGDNLMVVNMETGAGLNYSRDMIDGIHPTNCGYEKMATVWYEALTGKDAPGLKSCY